jgi:hypothetical protein
VGVLVFILVFIHPLSSSGGGCPALPMRLMAGVLF